MRIATWIFAVCLCAAVRADEVEDLVARGRNAHGNGKPGEALRLYQRALEIRPDCAEAMFEMGRTTVKIGQIAQGLDFMERGAALDPSYAWHYQIAEIANYHRHTEIAVSHYRSCLELCPDTALCQRLIDLCERAGKIEDAAYYRLQRVGIETASLRGLPFKEKVEVRTKQRSDLEAFLLHTLDKDLPEEKAQQVKDALVAFAIFPAQLDLRKLYVSLLTSQLVGFYDPDTGELYLVPEEPRDVWDQLVGAEEKPAEEMVVAHEFTHALQDQHFGLDRLGDRVKDNDDRYLAYESLVEGDATLAMFDYEIRPAALSSKDILAIRLAFGAQELFVDLSAQPEVPLVIQESMLFPYLEGFFFCLALREHSLWEGINRAYARMPPSTEHILHPEKYIAWQDLPLDFALKDLSSAMGGDWKEVYNNVIGEATCAMIFKAYGIAPEKLIARGWGGDRYSVLKNSQGELALIWLTVWDTPEDAREFFQGYRQILRRKHAGAECEETEKLLWQQGDRASAIGCDKSQVRVVENIPCDKLPEIWQTISGISPFVAEYSIPETTIIKEER